MSETTLAPVAPATAYASTRSSLAASLALVVGFWWAATGVTLAMQRSSLASAVSVAIASLLGVYGVVLIVQSRRITTVRSVRLAFLGSALVWWWCSTLFYAGIGIRIAENVSRGPRTFSLALQAIEATLRPDLFGVFALLAVASIVWTAVNRTALWTLAIFWGTLQTAKLNVFMGVRNSGVDWLPDHLAQLSQFFGPPQNSLLLPVTTIALAICCVVLIGRTRAATESYRQHLLAMLSFLMVLALLEHVLLGVNFALPLWDIFKPAH